MPLRKASNSLIGNSFSIFLSRFFPSVANLLVIIWYSKRLPMDVYGHYQSFWIQLFLLYPVACAGIHVLLMTYNPQQIASLARGIKARHYSIYFGWVALLGGVFALLQANTNGLPLLVPFLFLIVYSLSFVFESAVVVGRRYGILIAVNLIYALGYLVLHRQACKVGFQMEQLFAWLLAITAVRTVIFAWVGYRIIRTAEPGALATDRGQIQSLWLHLGLYDVVQLLSMWVDKFIISLLLTAELSAIYFNGSQNIPFLPLLLGAAGSAVLMQLARDTGGRSAANAVLLMRQSGALLSCIVFPVFFFLLTFSNEVMTVLFSEKYIAAVPVFVASIMVLPVRAYSFTTVLQREHRGDIINKGAVGELVLACALMYPLYLAMGLPGVALSFVISTYLQAAYYLHQSGRLLEVRATKLIPAGNWLIKLIVFGSLFIAIHYATSLLVSPRIGLYLGGAVLILSIAVSLLMEMNKQKAHGGK